jgi:hypothetical protein
MENSFVIIAGIIAVCLLIVVCIKSFSKPKLKIEDILKSDAQSVLNGLGYPEIVFYSKYKSHLFKFNVYNDRIVALCENKALEILYNNPNISKKLFLLEDEKMFILSDFTGELPPDSEPYGFKLRLNKQGLNAIKEILGKNEE